jgi:hypothetical protein
MHGMPKEADLNFIEVHTAEEANAIDLSVYCFVDFSEHRQVYIFKKRTRK